MPSPTVLSIIALIVSVAGFGLSFYLTWRDRSNVRAESFARQHERTGEYSNVFVTVTNAGRRPVILRYLCGLYEDGSQSRQLLEEAGLKLEEGEYHEVVFEKFDGIMINGDDMSGLVEIFLEDSVGKKHKVKGARKNIELVRKSKHPLGVQTHVSR